MFDQAKWIWQSVAPMKDEYVRFSFDFVWNGERALLRLCADSDYNLLINGALVAFGQYHTYEEQAVYEEISLENSLRMGENSVEILVWYYGEANFSYSVGRAGLLFELLLNDRVALYSDERTACAIEPRYARGACKPLTAQLGLSYAYDATRSAPATWENAVVVQKPYPVKKRPVSRLIMENGVQGTPVGEWNGKKYVYDFGEELVGFLSFSLACEKESEVTISYGEHLVGGEVPRKIRSRDFSFSYRAPVGESAFCNAFRRLGCRYVSFESDVPFRVTALRLLPTVYPLSARPFAADTPLRQRIYDTALHTLRLCMHEHYEDCPWREQALYTMDSRNQMLCTYLAFGEYAFPRASLDLFATARRCGGLLPICAPCDCDVTIPSFSLHYFAQVEEYLQYSRDVAYVRGIYGSLLSLLDAFNVRLTDGLLPEFEGETYWNFYEWREGLDKNSANRYNLILNALYLRALQAMARIARVLGEADDFSARVCELQRAIRAYFYDETRGLFLLGREEPLVTELGNYLCVLTGVVKGREARALIDTLQNARDVIPLTLSMRCFAYDAQLLVDKAHFAPRVLADIDTRWGRMLDAGATSFWETELGALDFNGAGSLCHGWSALPIYYYHTLIKGEHMYENGEG